MQTVPPLSGYTNVNTDIISVHLKAQDNVIYPHGINTDTNTKFKELVDRTISDTDGAPDGSRLKYSISTYSSF